jgi:hypothetical protein
VPVAFYEGFIQPIFALRRAVVYVLPEIRSVAEAFGVLRAMACERQGAS